MVQTSGKRLLPVSGGLSIEKIVLDVDGLKTVEIQVEGEGSARDLERLLNYRTLAIFAAGLVNGINPCSMSMLLMFMSLLLFNLTHKKSPILS